MITPHATTNIAPIKNTKLLLKLKQGILNKTAFAKPSNVVWNKYMM